MSPKKGEGSQVAPIANVAIILVLLLDSASKYLRVSQGLDEWLLVAFRGAWTLGLALLTRILYSAS